jgi:UDP-N-acetylmuramate dehydrogenase
LVLSPGISTDINRIARETVAERNKRHIQNVRAAGSFFMNPVAPEAVCKQFMEEKDVAECRGGRVPAGWLIERAECKGLRKGGAVASRQHPNYLVNERKASAKSVCELANIIRAAVKKKTGIVLQPEAHLVNCELNKMV